MAISRMSLKLDINRNSRLGIDSATKYYFTFFNTEYAFLGFVVKKNVQRKMLCMIFNSEPWTLGLVRKTYFTNYDQTSTIALQDKRLDNEYRHVQCRRIQTFCRKEHVVQFILWQFVINISLIAIFCKTFLTSFYGLCKIFSNTAICKQ